MANLHDSRAVIETVICLLAFLHEMFSRPGSQDLSEPSRDGLCAILAHAETLLRDVIRD